MNWTRFSNPLPACPIGPDVIMHAPADQLAEVSWQPSRISNPKPKVVVPGAGNGWDDFYVRTALIRASNWREGSRGPVVKTPEKALEILQHLGYLDHERVVTLSLDEKWKLLAIHEVSVGGLHGCAILPRDLLRVPILVGASRFLMAHNHPSDDPTPSADDLRMTAALLEAADAIDIQMVDHLTIARGRKYESISEYGTAMGPIAKKFAKLRPPAADTTFRAELDPVAMATRPYGKYDKFLVRTAMIEAPGRRPGPVLNDFDKVTATLPVQALRHVSSEAMVVLCLSGANQLIAVNVKVGRAHDIGVRGVFGVASTVPTGAVIIAHNHPSGFDIDQERVLYVNLTRGLKALGTPLLDSLVVEKWRITPMAE